MTFCKNGGNTVSYDSAIIRQYRHKLALSFCHLPALLTNLFTLVFRALPFRIKHGKIKEKAGFERGVNMADFAKMYRTLFNSQTDAIAILQQAQKDTEKMYSSAPNLEIRLPEQKEPEED